MSILEILSRHIADVCSHGDIECRCGEQCDTPEDHRGHVAQVLEQHEREAKAGAWDRGAVTAWERSTPEVNGSNYHWRSSGEPRNPYRKETKTE